MIVAATKLVRGAAWSFTVLAVVCLVGSAWKYHDQADAIVVPVLLWVGALSALPALLMWIAIAVSNPRK